VFDAAPPPHIEQQIRSISAATPGVHSIDMCRVRKSGLVLFVEIHVVVDGDVSVRRGHEIAHEVKDALLASTAGIEDVTVHIEPPDVTGGGMPTA
jgi:divalent metal cation (Fe/Co/Zn/Cd) transporter